MKAKQFDAVVSDMRMPEMNGAELLGRIKDEFPEAVRFILSGHSDNELVMRSIGCTHQYLAKPCDPVSLVASLNNSFALRGLLGREELVAQLSKVSSLPTLPDTYQELLAALADENSSIEVVARIISKDVGMTTTILHMVNSAFFGLPRKVESPQRAVSILGLETIKSLVMMAGVFDQLKIQPFHNLSIELIYSHCLKVGVKAQKIARYLELDKRVVDESFMAGTMHDIGKAIMLVYLREELSQAFEVSEVEGMSVFEAEEAIHDITHAEIGAYLLSIWGEPDPIVEAVARHHHPGATENADISALTCVHLANAFYHYDSTDDTSKWVNPTLDEEYLKLVGVADRVEELRAQVTVE
jgi:putative nucleotidyltransferase with HDIG domain